MSKKYFKVLVTCLLLLLLVDCTIFSQASNSQTSLLPAGSGFVEKEITDVSGVKAAGTIKFNSKGQLIVYDSSSKTPLYAVLSSTGKRVAAINGDFNGDGNAFTLDKQDNLYVFAQNRILDDKKQFIALERQICIYNQSGKLIKKYALGRITGKQITPVQAIAVDTQGNIYAATRTGVEVFGQDGQPKKTINTGLQGCFLLDTEGDNLLIGGMDFANRGGVTLVKINPVTGQTIWKQSLEVNGGVSCGFYNRTDKCFYLVDNGGIVKCDASGKELGIIMDLKAYNVLGFETRISGICVDKNAKQIYLTNINQSVMAGPSGPQVMMTANQMSQIYQYTFTNKLSAPKNQKIVTLSTIMSGPYLDLAISQFQKKHPDIKIEIQTMQQGNMITKTDMEKYVKTINTQFMTGKGADIISLSNLPYQKYADKNLLVDLSSMMDKDRTFDLRKYYTNIFDACKYNGKLYAMPVSIMFWAMVANQNILDNANIKIDDTKWTWTDFVSIAKKVTQDINGDGKPDQYALPNVELSQLFSNIMRDKMNQFIDPVKKEAHFDKAEFIELLNMCKELADQNLINPQANPNPLLMDKNVSGTVVFMPSLIYNYTVNMTGGNVIIRIGGDSSNIGSTNNIYNLPSSDVKSGVFQPSPEMFFGINKRSKHQQEAWEFIKYLLSDEAQTPPILTGFAVNKDAEKQRASNEYNQEIVRGVKNPISQDDISRIENMLGNLSFLENGDMQLNQIIREEIQAFFTGQRSAAETAKMLQSKVETYLME